MSINNILFTVTGDAITPAGICDEIAHFSGSYINATRKIVHDSKEMDGNGEVFFRCTSLILSNFRMTRSGRFLERIKGENRRSNTSPYSL
jgi:hypothetical protein